MKVYTLSELCDRIGAGIKSEFYESALVTAEISGLQLRNGHCYMELIEKGDNNTLHNARIRAFCWASAYNMLSAYFREETGQSLQNGMKVLVEVEVTFHNVYGLSLNIIGIDPKYTLGDMLQQREAAIKKLKEDGIYDMNHMLAMPTLPRCIAVVSSADAAGYEDFCNQLTNSTRHYAFKITLFNATMQGDNAVKSVCNALDKIAVASSDFDVVLITRGGGSSNDLTCFDDYTLCSYIAQFPLPVITAIGHTKDISIADQVAKYALKTPTAAAAFIIEQFDIQADKISDLEHRMKLSLSNLTKNKLIQLDNYRNKLINAYHIIFQKKLNKLELIEHTIKLQSPKRILQQGYSITLLNGRPVHSVKELHSGDRISTDMLDGTISSVVE